MNYFPDDQLSTFIQDQRAHHPESSREFAQFTDHRIYSWWTRLVNEVKSLKILSYGLSANGNTYEVRVRGTQRYVFRFHSFAIGPDNARHGVFSYLFDEVMNKIGKRHIPEIVVTNICNRRYTNVATNEWVQPSVFGTSVLAAALLDEPGVEQVVRQIDEGLRKFGSDGESDKRKSIHAKKRALSSIVPGVREFLRQGGTYEEMVEILQTELVNTVQTE